MINLLLLMVQGGRRVSRVTLAITCVGVVMAQCLSPACAKPLHPEPPSSKPILGRYMANSVYLGYGVRASIADVCRPLVANFNQFRDVPFESNQPRFSPKYPQFRSIWKPMPWNQELAKSLYVPCKSKACIKEGEPAWRFWLDYTKPLRQAGETLLWSARIDLLGDGRYETLIRLTHIFGPNIIDGKSIPAPPLRPYSRYFDSLIYMLPSSDPQMAKTFNDGANVGFGGSVTDIIQNVGDKVVPYLTLSWSRSSSGLGVTRFMVSPGSSYDFYPLCNIRWIPRKE